MVGADGALQIIEVKSVGPRALVEHRVSYGQRRRLRNIVAYFESRFERVELWLALVDSRNKVQVFDEF